MKLFKLSLILMLPALLAACTDESIPSANVGASVADQTLDVAVAQLDQYRSPTILTRLSRCGQTGCTLDKNAGPSSYASPLFALATAPNQDILVADAGAGIVSAGGSKAQTSIALPGVTGVAPIGRGAMWASVGAGDETPGEDTGQAVYLVSNGATHMIADLFLFEEANNPEPSGLLESNPFDVQAISGGAVVADAAANDLLHVDNQGNIRVLAILPPTLASTANLKALAGCPSPSPFCGAPDFLPAQAVPTSVAIGPDGYYYVGELRGFPAPTNESSVWRVSPNANGAVCGASEDCVKVFDGGFTSIIDLAFAADGHLLVAEMDESSWLAVELGGPSASAGTVNSCDLETLACTEVAAGIPMLTAITATNGGAIWATRNALIPGLAEVIQVQ